MSNRINESLQNNAILAEIINLSADAVISLDSKYNIVLVNAAFERIFGYSETEILGQSLNVLLPETMHSRHNYLMEAYEGAGEDSRYMGKMAKLFGLSKSGEKIPLDIAIQTHPEGSLCRFTAICRDIRNRLKQESRVREGEAKFRTLFDTSHHFIMLMDGDGGVLDINDTAVRLLHKKPGDYIGSRVWDCDFWASEMDFSLIERVVTNLKPDRESTLIANAIGAGNKKIILEITLKVIWVEYKKSTLIVLEGKDITQIVRSNKALVESESRLARAQKIARLGNYQWIIASNKTLWSDEIYAIFGLSPESFDPDYESFLTRVHPDDREFVDNCVISALKNDHSYEFTCRILLDDGSEKIIEGLGEISRLKDGTPVRIEGTMQDITVSWTREQELISAKRQAEEANIAKAQFLSTVSHELRTPLNAIIGFGAMIAEEQLGEINIPSYRDYAVDINTSGKELLLLIENILNVTSFELGSIKYQPCLVSAQSLLDYSLPLIQDRAAEKNINIKASISNGMPELYLDRQHTQQILVHLVDNAIKFSIENDTVEINLYQRDDEFIIEVIDQGIGLEEVDIETIFDLFVQKDMTFNKVYGGVGLGLTIVKNLTELQGGRVQVESGTGQGSCFSVCFSTTDTKVVPMARGGLVV